MFYRKYYFLRLPNRNISDPNLIFQSYVSHMHVKKAKFNYADASVKLKKIEKNYLFWIKIESVSLRSGMKNGGWRHIYIRWES